MEVEESRLRRIELCGIILQKVRFVAMYVSEIYVLFIQ